MRWRSELGGVVRSLPSAQKKLLLLLALVVLGAFAVPFFQLAQFSMLRGSDSTGYYLWLRSAMVDGDWDFENDLKVCNTLTAEFRAELLKLPRTEAGRWPNKYGIGWAVLSAPFYLVADGIVATGRAIGLWSLERDGYNVVYQICIQSGHFLLGLTGLLLAWRWVTRWCGDGTAALWGVLLILAASPQLYYLTLKLSLSHNAAFFAIALMLWAGLEAEKGAGRLWPWVVAGAGWGLAVTLRFQLALFAVVPAWQLLLRWRDGEKRAQAMGSALAWLAGAAPLLFLQFYAWRMVYGQWFVFTYGAEGERFFWTKPEILNLLFSPYHGFFYWHPFLLVGAIGYVCLTLKFRGLHVAGFLAILGTIYVNAAWWCWWFAGSFGSRAFEGVLIFFMAGLALLFVRLPPFGRRILWAAAITAGVWNVAIMALYYASVIPRNAPVTWLEMVQAGARGLTGLWP